MLKNGKLSVLNELCVNELSMGVRGGRIISMHGEVGELNHSCIVRLACNTQATIQTAGKKNTA